MPIDDNTTPTSAAETLLWTGHTSQWVHFWFYFFCVMLAVAAGVAIPFTAGLSAIGFVLPIGMWIVRWWATKCTAYELTSQRLRIRSGILNRRLDEMELYRVKDYAMEQPLMLRMFGLGNLTLITSDATNPQVAMRAIPQVETVREQLRAAVQSERDRKRVREMDVGTDPHPV